MLTHSATSIDLDRSPAGRDVSISTNWQSISSPPIHSNIRMLTEVPSKFPRET